MRAKPRLIVREKYRHMTTKKNNNPSSEAARYLLMMLAIRKSTLGCSPVLFKIDCTSELKGHIGA